MFNSSDEKQLLGKFCRAVEATGGIEYSERCTPYIIADPNWTDLACLYVEATRKLDITIRGRFGVVQHYWLPDGTLLKPELLNGVRQMLVDQKPLTEGAVEYLKHVLQSFNCEVNQFELEQIIGWCKEVGPPGLILPKQSDTLKWAPPDLVDLNSLCKRAGSLYASLLPGEINKLQRIPWYVAAEGQVGDQIILVSLNELRACVDDDDLVTMEVADSKGLQINSVVRAREEKYIYATERFFLIS